MNISYVIKVLQKPDTSDKVFFTTQQHKLSACVFVVFPDGLDNLFQANLIFVQTMGVYPDLILKDMPANRKDICYTRHSLQLIFDDPVIYLTKICSWVLSACINIGCKS